MVCVLGLLGASATMAAPVPEPEAGWAAAAPAVAGLGYAAAPAAALGYAAAPAVAGLGYAAAPAAGLGLAGVGYAGIAAAPALAAAPVAAVAAAPVNIPAPAITQHVSGPDAVSVHQPPPVVTKKIEYGTRPYVAAYDTTVIKPVLGDLDIAVPTALKGTVSHNAPITRVSKEPFVVNEPV